MPEKIERTYLGIDPGYITGVALLRPSGEFGAIEVDSTFAVADFITDLWEQERWSKRKQLVICYEKFAIQPRTLKTARQYDALYFNGWLIHFFRRLRPEDGIVLVQQTPAQAKSFSTNNKLEAVGWYTASPGGHANDAAKHILLAAVRDYAIGKYKEQHAPLMRKLEALL